MKRLAQHLWVFGWPFILIAALALFAWAIPRVFGAQEPTVSRGPVKPGWFSCQPELGPNREFTKWEIVTEYFVVVIEPSGERRVESLGTVPTDLLKGTRGVFFGTTFYSDRMVAGLLNEILMRSYRETFPVAPEDDERTRLLRP